MFNLFNKGSKVKEGKQKKEKQTTAAVSAAVGKKGAPKFAALQDAFKKLNKMDRKQAYTWGAVALVVLVGLVVLGSAVGSNGEEDFADFETRGYDLASMPFSTDEAEKYLLASKYPDMKETNAIGLYSKEEKEARQAEDEIPFETESANTSTASSGGYYGGGYGGGYSGGSRGGSTPINSLNSAGLKGSSGSGINSTFGPKGDFSNFRSQERGNDKFVPQKGKKADARTALFQTAKASRAAAGLKNDKLLNAKKSMMGGNIKGSDAFADDSGRVNLSSAGGLELDTNAPVQSADLSGLDDAVNEAKEAAEDNARDEDEDKWWKDLLVDLGKQAFNVLLNAAVGTAQDAIAAARAERMAEQNAWQEQVSQQNLTMLEKGKTSSGADIKTAFETDPTIMKNRGWSMDTKTVDSTTTTTYSRDGKVMFTEKTQLSADGQPLSTWVTSDDVPKNGVRIPNAVVKKQNNEQIANWKQTDPTGYANAMSKVEAAGNEAKSNHYNKKYNKTSYGNSSTGVKPGDVMTYKGITYEYGEKSDGTMGWKPLSN